MIQPAGWKARTLARMNANKREAESAGQWGTTHSIGRQIALRCLFPNIPDERLEEEARLWTVE